MTVVNPKILQVAFTMVMMIRSRLAATGSPARKRMLLAVCSLASFVACTPTHVVHTDRPATSAAYSAVPLSSNFPTSAQLQLQAAQHWASIADDTGKAISALMAKGGACNPGTRSCDSIFINPPAVITGFSRTFHNQLITTLVSSGMNVSKSPESSVVIDIDVQPVVFASNRPQYRYASVDTELGPGIWALRDVSTMNPGERANTPPASDALHWFRTEFAAGQTPKMEIVVTVSASTRTRYLARATSAYYVTDGDRRLYDQEICSLMQPCASQAVAEDTSAPAKPVARLRAIGITGDCPLDKTCCPTAGKPCVEDEVKPKSARN